MKEKFKKTFNQIGMSGIFVVVIINLFTYYLIEIFKNWQHKDILENSSTAISLIFGIISLLISIVLFMRSSETFKTISDIDKIKDYLQEIKNLRIISEQRDDFDFKNAKIISELHDAIEKINLDIQEILNYESINSDQKEYMLKQIALRNKSLINSRINLSLFYHYSFLSPHPRGLKIETLDISDIRKLIKIKIGLFDIARTESIYNLNDEYQTEYSNTASVLLDKWIEKFSNLNRGDLNNNDYSRNHALVIKMNLEDIAKNIRETGEDFKNYQKNYNLNRDNYHMNPREAKELIEKIRRIAKSCEDLID